MRSLIDQPTIFRLARSMMQARYGLPDERDEAMRDLVRAREDAVAMQRQARQRLQALLLRNEIRYPKRTTWTEAHRRWIAHIKLAQPNQQIAFEEYVQGLTLVRKTSR